MSLSEHRSTRTRPSCLEHYGQLQFRMDESGSFLTFSRTKTPTWLSTKTVKWFRTKKRSIPSSYTSMPRVCQRYTGSSLVHISELEALQGAEITGGVFSPIGMHDDDAHLLGYDLAARECF